MGGSCGRIKISDYIEAHLLEYRELTYYGEYTARYREECLASGTLQGLEAEIMEIVCVSELKVPIYPKVF